MKQQGDDVASWWPWNVFEVLVSCYGDVMEMLGLGCDDIMVVLDVLGVFGLIYTWLFLDSQHQSRLLYQPLTLLTQKNNTYVWGDKRDKAFRILKEKLCNALVLALPDGPDDFEIELLSDYECEIKYHPGKANVVADALSRKERLKPRRVRAMSITIHYGLKTKILEAQREASKELKAPAEWLRGLETHFERRDDGGIYLFDRIWIPSVGGVRKLIMDEAYTSRYSIHPGADKMYHDLRDLYWWPGMKRDIVEYVSKCLTCSKIKAEHQKPSGLLRQPEIREWKWEKITMDLVIKLPRSIGGYDAIWVIVDRLTKSAHLLPILEDYKTEKLARIYINEIVARHGVPVSIILDCDGRFASHLWQALQKALELMQETTEKIIQIKERLTTARSRQKSYADKRRKPLEFKVGDRVLLKVSPWKGVVRFGKKGKLAPRYVGPFEIVECVGPVVYRLKLPQELSCVHDTFHVSNLKKCLAEPDVQVPLEEIEIDENLRFVEEPIEIVDRDVKKLKRRRNPLVKVRWNSRQGAEYTWEREDQFRKKYPHLFSKPVLRCDSGGELRGYHEDGLYVKCVLTQKALDAFCNKFHIPEEVHPVLPNQNDTMHERPARKIGLYTRFFDFANFKLPLSTFLVDVLRHFRINISQLFVIGAAKSGWKSFSKRSDNAFVCYTKPLDSLKNWNNHFFWVDNFTFPASFPWHAAKHVTRDPAPVAADFSAQDYATLVAHPFPFWKFPEAFMCLVGLSRHYTLDEETYP
ncbi:putative reverse transcriptase domain-containing protein [Tanacetum coccineum]